MKRNEHIHKAVDTYDWVIYLADEWEQFFKRHLIRELARQLPHSRILCVARPLCLVTGALRGPREFGTWLENSAQVTTLAENVFHFRPGILLHDHLAAHIPMVERINRHWLRGQLRVAGQQVGLRWGNLIAVVYDPFQLGCLGLVGESFTIYDCYDDYYGWPETRFLRTKRQLLRNEEIICEKVDLVFAVSEMIGRRIEQMYRRVHVSASAADVGHFGRARDQVAKIPVDVDGIPKPIVGYLGNVTSRIDFDLLRHVAMSRGEWSMVLIGGVSERSFSVPDSLTQLGNVHWLGGRRYESLPKYLRAFNVCIIPYTVDDPWNINCSPLKLYEYLATGKPIVSTDLPAVRPFAGLVRIAHNAIEFERQVEEALQERDESMTQRRLAAAQENTWENRAAAVIEIINSSLKERQV